jgi:DNA-binding Lrp family transcriptional regulator
MDIIDVQICKMLALNSRTPYREIGNRFNLSVNSIHKRIQALTRSGVINRFIARPSLKLLDATVLLIFAKSKSRNITKTIKQLGSNSNTYRIVLAAGNVLYVHGVIRKMSEMERYISFVTSQGEMEESELGIVSSSEKMDVTLSALDYQIMRSLSEDSRKDLSGVSKELGVSTRTVKRRLDRMMDAGAINLSIEFNPAASSSVTAMIHLKLGSLIDKQAVIAQILNRHQDNVLSIAGLDNHPDVLIINFWTGNMKELREIQDELEGTGNLKAVVPHIFYNSYIFKSWMDDIPFDTSTRRKK